MMKGLTAEEIWSIAERIKADTSYPKVKQVMNGVINLTNDSCPNCGLNIYENSRIIRIKEKPKGDYVRYICKCGTAFFKYEKLDPEER